MLRKNRPNSDPALAARFGFEGRANRLAATWKQAGHWPSDYRKDFLDGSHSFDRTSIKSGLRQLAQSTGDGTSSPLRNSVPLMRIYGVPGSRGRHSNRRAMLLRRCRNDRRAENGLN